jgi:fibronectin-binding autotransporter adhesin
MNMSGGTIDIEGGILRNGGYGSAIWTSNYASMNIAAGATLDLWDGNAVMVDGLTGNGTVTHTAQGGSTNLTVGVDNDINGPATFAGSFVETNGHTISLTKVGTGVQVLTGVNGYTAGTTVDGGTLIFVNNQSGSANYTDNATLEFDVTIGTQQLNGGTISGNGRLNINGGGTVLFGAENSPENISLSAGGLIDVSGSGTLLRNEYSNGNWAQNYASLEVDSGATVNLWDSPGGITVDALNGSGTVTHTSYGGTENLTVGIAGGSGTFSGIISDTPGYSLSLIKTGAGTQTLTNSGNTYVGGTTINAGTLAAVGEALSTGNVTLAGGTLAVNDGVTANAQTLTTGNQMWKASSAYTARVFNDGSADLLSLTAAGSGTLTIDSSVTSDTPFTVHVTGATGSLSATTSQDWVIANGITTLTGVTNPTPGNPTVVATAGAHASASGFVLDMPSDLFTGNNNGFATTPVLEFEDTGGLYSLDVVYTDAPEPGTAVLVLGALVPSILGRRRRKNERGLL